MEDGGAKKTRGRGRGAVRGARGGRGKGRGRGRGRNAKAAIESDDEQMQTSVNDDSVEDANSPHGQIDKSPPLNDNSSSPAIDQVAAASATTAAGGAFADVATLLPAAAGIAIDATAAAVVPNPDDPSSSSVTSTTQPATTSDVGTAAAAVAVAVATIDMETDISQMETPTFTTLSREPPPPMTRLKWDHKVNLIGEKCLSPRIHCCHKCVNQNPILVYGRMIPCKHVFCLECSRKEAVTKVCSRCKDKVTRVEQSPLAAVYMCFDGGKQYDQSGCRRTYLSERDLLAHINHRHVSATGEKATTGIAM